MTQAVIPTNFLPAKLVFEWGTCYVVANRSAADFLVFYWISERTVPGSKTCLCMCPSRDVITDIRIMDAN